MREIALTKGRVAIVDDEDYDAMSALRWNAFHYDRKNCYAARQSSRKAGRRHAVWMHRLICEMHRGEIPPGMQVDHINGNTLDNRLVNLRTCTHAQNIMNQRITRAHSSKFKGVTWDKRESKWMAYIKHNYAFTNLGYFDSEEEAARAYDRAAEEYFKEFAAPNFDRLERKGTPTELVSVHKIHDPTKDDAEEEGKC